jgi:uncharacterized lipoprotein YajG
MSQAETVCDETGPGCAAFGPDISSIRKRRDMMKKVLIASASSLAFLALAACSDTDDTQTQSIDEPAMEEQQLQQDDPAAVPPADDQVDEAPSQ